MVAAKAIDEGRTRVREAADLLREQGFTMRSLVPSIRRAPGTARIKEAATGRSPAITLLVAGTEAEERAMTALLDGAQHVVMVRTVREAVRIFFEYLVAAVVLSDVTEDGQCLVLRELAKHAQAHFGILVHETSPTAPRVLRWQS